MDVVGGADGDDVLGRGRLIDGLAGWPQISRGEDDDHFLVAGRRIRGAGGLGVARQRVKFLRLDAIVAIGTVVAPTVVADAGATLVGLVLQLAVADIVGGVIRVKNDGGPQLNERTNSQAIMETRVVGKWVARQVVVSADDVRVDRAVAVASLQRAAGIGRPFQAGVSDSAGGVGVAPGVKTNMVRRGRAVVDAAVGHVHDKGGGAELFLGEARAGEPGEVAGAGGHVAG